MADYPQWRKDRCPHCAAGIVMHWYNGDHVHWYDDNRHPNHQPKCSAPTADELIAELEEQVAKLEEQLATHK